MYSPSFILAQEDAYSGPGSLLEIVHRFEELLSVCETRHGGALRYSCQHDCRCMAAARLYTSEFFAAFRILI